METRQMDNSEVRLFYKTRIDWDTVYFSSTCSTDLCNQAAKIAKEHHADHFNCGMATEKDQELMTDAKLARRIVAASNIKDQVEMIVKAIGRAER